MTVMILHPNDELFFADLQKELIKSLFVEGRIIYSQIPLWIELGDFDIKDAAGFSELADFDIASSIEASKKSADLQKPYPDDTLLKEEIKNTIRGFENRTLKECREMGINDSMEHNDFMIGYEGLDIDAVTRDGKTVPIFRRGRWAFEV